jgi:xanthine dehydrogenase accessory factor
MSSTQIAERISELTVARTPFVRATVVRAQAPTSVQAGDDAIVLADGTMEGFVGGQCTQNSVRTAALAALSGSTATLLRVLPDDSDPFPATPGAQVVVNPCQSGGAVEIFLEPVLPPPLISVTGSTPIAQALRGMTALLGYGVVDPADGRTGADRDGRSADELAGCLAVLLASHGPGEPETIRAALAAGVPYIGLVASRKRSAALFDEMGLNEAERARVHAPAGRWIGARTAPEIALSILTDVVAAIRIDGAAPAAAVQSAATSQGNMTSPSAEEPRPAPAAAGLGMLTPVQAIDPVCHMTVTVMPDTPHARVDGVDYYFCNPGCRVTFLADHAEAPSGPHADTANAR